MKNNQSNFLSIISKSELPKIVEDLAEIKIDSKISNEIVKEIPILKTILGFTNLAGSISDFLFTKKIANFLNELQKIDLEKRKKLVMKINKDDKYATKVGETVLCLIEKSDSNEKPVLMARAFKAYANEEISFEELNRIILGIDRMLMLNKDYFIQYATKIKKQIKRIPYYSTHNLAEAGFINLVTGWDDLISEINDLGEKFYKYVLVPKEDMK